jgi:hypothetical protein
MPVELPQIRPGLVKDAETMTRVVAFFPDAAEGNVAIQLITVLGIPADRLGVVTPDQIEHGQGMVLSIGCPDPKLVPRVENLCRRHGAQIHRQWR